MTRRDIVWRAIGVALTLGGCAASITIREGSPVTLLFFLVAIVGIVLAANGKRVAVAFKAERRGHRDTATVIHEKRLRWQKRTMNNGKQ